MDTLGTVALIALAGAGGYAARVYTEKKPSATPSAAPSLKKAVQDRWDRFRGDMDLEEYRYIVFEQDIPGDGLAHYGKGFQDLKKARKGLEDRIKSITEMIVEDAASSVGGYYLVGIWDSKTDRVIDEVSISEK